MPVNNLRDDDHPDAILQQQATLYGLRMVSNQHDVELAPSLLSSLPVEWARKHVILPVMFEGTAVVLVCDPASIDQQDYISTVVGRNLEPVLAPRQLVESCIEKAYTQREGKTADFIDNLTQVEPSATRKVDDLLLESSGAPVTQLINHILRDALNKRASDIHFEPFETRLRIRFRIDGVLYEQESPPHHVVQSLVSRLKVMAHMDIAERRLPQDGMARVSIGEREIDIRVSTIPVSEGERVVLRLLDKGNTLLGTQELGMNSECHQRLSELLKQPHGMVIVSGPTGSGKTTTLYAILQELDATRHNILTIEDPIEYQLDDVGQIQVKTKIGLTFSSGLRHILRQDPDIILVGETRDAETAEIAVRASLTGHLVFTTLHTNDAPSAVVRLMDIGIAPYLISACLRGVLAQRLVRRLCPFCRKEVCVSPDDRPRFGIIFESLAGLNHWQASGCPKCTKGYRGRVGLFELLTVGRDLRDYIRQAGVHLETIREMATANGMKPLVKDGVEKILSGSSSVDDVLGAVVL